MRNVPSSLVVSHVADQPRRYPGEPVTLHTRVQVLQATAGFSLRIALPAGLALEQAARTGEQDWAPAEMLVLEGQQYVQWSIEGPLDTGECFDFHLRGAIEQTAVDLLLTSRALVMAKGGGRYHSGRLPGSLRQISPCPIRGAGRADGPVSDAL
jgi:hypothetical protein